MEICVGIVLLMIFGPLVFKLLGAILRGLGPVIAVIVAAAIVLGIGALVFQIVSSLISGAVNVIF
ncbi:MAG TPA: hypothetical protein VER79_00895, partial [Candidatus Limnocylindrales bacterium]|nr:hypothetical protein [Candidatus Limnocylindrales bacterium]